MKKIAEESRRDLEHKSAEAVKSKEDMEMRMQEIEKLNKLMVGRELKMIELKKENEELKKKLSEK